MWWKSKKPAASPKQPQQQQSQAPSQTPSQTPSQAQAQPQQAVPAPTMHKGIYLSALVYIEGDQPAPDDFTALTTSALKQVLGDAFKGSPQGLTMTLKKVDVQNDVEDDGDSPKEASFQF